MRTAAARLRRALRLPALRGKDWRRLAAVLAVVAAVIAVEWSFGTVRDFYQARPLQAGVLTGALLSAVAYFGFDAVRAQLNESRWSPLSTLAFVSLAYQTTLIIDVLLWLVTEIEPSNDAAPDAELQQQLVGIRRAAGRREPPHRDLGKVACPHYRGELEALLADPDWRELAIQQLDRWKWRNRDGIATWAAAMLSTGEAAAVLNRLAQVNESVSVVQEWLRALAGHPGYQDRAASAAGALGAWMAAHAEATSVREDLMRAARGLPPQYREFRAALEADQRQRLADRDERAEWPAQAREMLVTPFADVPSAAPSK